MSYALLSRENRDASAELLCKELAITDGLNLEFYKPDFPSHQLLADALEGLQRLSRHTESIYLIDLWSTFLLLYPSYYSSETVSTRPERNPRNERYTEVCKQQFHLFDLNVSLGI